MCKKVFSVVLAVLMVLAVIPFAHAAAIVENGKCGENVTYTLDENGLLTISGEGNMFDYDRGDSPFYESTDIKTAVIENGVTSISGYAFYNCAGLTSVVIGNGVTYIGFSAFYGCTGIESITVDENNTAYHTEGHCLIETASKTLVLGCKNSVIPTDGSVTSIGYYAFYDCAGLTSILIPDSVTSISYFAFSGCTGLTSILIPDSVKSIGEYAFLGCTGLPSVVIPDSVKSIGEGAFSGCTGLTSVVIPDSVTSIGGFAFHGCTGLTSIAIPDSITSIGNCTFEDCTGLTSFVIGNSVKSIGNYAFRGCTGLTSIVIGNRVKSIGNYVFEDCTGLASIVFLNPETKISSWNVIPKQTVIHGYPGSTAQSYAEENGNVFIALEGASITLKAPEEVNEPFVSVGGYASPAADIQIYVDGKEALTVQSAATGKWTANVLLPDAADGETYTIKAKVTVQDETDEASAYVTYTPEAVLMEEFALTHSCYSLSRTAADTVKAVPNFTFVPGTPMAFKVKVSNEDKIEKLYAVSTKNGEKKKLELTKLDNGYWYGNGYFDGDTAYTPGIISIEGKDKNGEEFTAYTIKINFLIDPSGTVYEAVESNKIEGATARIFYRDAEGHELIWNADEFEQINPVTTLSDGAFNWVVPEGKWQVRVSKDGYEEARSEWMDVPPEHTNVAIPLVSYASPKVSDVHLYADYADIVFSQYMKIDTVNADTVNMEGYTVQVTPLDTTETKDGSGVFFAKAFRVTPTAETVGKEVKITVNNAESYNGYTCSYSGTVQSGVPAANFKADAQSSCKIDGKTVINVSADNAADRTVSAKCSGAGIALEKDSVVLDKNGKGQFTVQGLMPGDAGIEFTIEGTMLTAKTTVTVTMEAETPAEHTHSFVKTAAKAAACTANGNNEYYTCTECQKVFKADKVTETTAAAEVIKATGHKSVSVAAKAATCTETGLTAGSKCSVCGTVLTAQTTVPATGHKPVPVAAKATTCTETGLTAGSKCSVCGTVLTTQKVVPAAGHKWDSGKVTTEPTYEKTGVKTFTCSVCKTTKTEPVAKLEKTYTPGDVDGDGKISASDARLALRQSVGLEKYAEGSDEFLACDVDKDGNVTAADARLILRASVGLEKPETWKKA